MKNSLKEDEIPLTNDSSPSRSITQETRSRFDNLLRAALSKEKGNKRKKKRNKKKEDDIELEERNHPEELGSTSARHNEGFDNGDEHFKEENQRRDKVKDSGHNGTHLSGDKFTSGVEFLSASDDDVIPRHLDNHSGRTLLPKLKTRRKLDAPGGDSLTTAAMVLTRDEPIQSPNKDSIHETEVKERSPYKHPPIRRLSYVIHKFGDSSGEPSPSEELPSTKPARPTPTPRKIEQHTLADTGDSAHSPNHGNSRQDEDLTVPEPHEPAPPLYSQPMASYENLEKDGGTPPKPRRKRRDKRKKEGEELIEMQSIPAKLSGPIASYEEITPSRRPSSRQKPRASSPEVQTAVAAALSREKRDWSYEKIIGISVHRSDRLQSSRLVAHPLVKVCIVDERTGEYVKKSDPTRSVSYFDENDDVDYVAPVMTREFDFHSRRSVIPCWEELIVLNEDINCILNPEKPVIILFEILDFVSFSVASAQHAKLGPDGGWHRVAWAFLKPVGPTGSLNTDEPRRLQLYAPSKPSAPPGRCNVYSWWRGGARRKYPATLNVTVRGVVPPQDLPRVLRSRLPLQGETAAGVAGEGEGDAGGEEVTHADSAPANGDGTNVVKWSRLPSQSCKVPNKRALGLQTASKGCFVVKFSNAGLWLACATLSTDEYTILVYSIPSGKLYATLPGHQGLVYDLHWSTNDGLLLSASADCTACIWDVKSRRHSKLLQMLPHPGFVYCVRFSPASDALIVTGCCDNVVRIWSKAQSSATFELLEELEEHAGYVSAICFDKNGLLISGDSLGRILVWPAFSQHDRVTPRDLNVRELHDVVINCLAVHPGGRRLLVHARDSLLRMIDLATGSVIQWFHGGLNYWVQTYACLSPCGGLVLAASEDGTACVWRADTGDQLAAYAGLHPAHAGGGCGGGCVDYHPHEHMAAFCASDCPTVVVCSLDRASDGADVGLQMLDGRASRGEDARSDDRSDVARRLEDLLTVGTTLKEVVGASMNGYKSDDARSVSGFSKHGDSFLSSTRIAKSPYKIGAGPTGAKLGDIIEMMDQVLLSATPSRHSRQMSGRSTPSKAEVSIAIDDCQANEETPVRVHGRSRRHSNTLRQSPVHAD